MLKRLLGKDSRENYISMLTQLERVLTPEEHDEVMQLVMENPRFPTRTVIEMIGRLYLISNPRVKLEKLKFIEDILIQKRAAGTCKSVIEQFEEIIDPITKQTLYKIMRELANDDDIPPMIGLLKSDDTETRRAVSDILVQMNHPLVAKGLVESLEKGGWSNKAEALNLLYEVGRVESIIVCRKLMETGNEADRKHAIGILQKLGSDEAVNTLNLAIDLENSPRSRLLIARALQKMGNPNVIHPLIKLLQDSKKEIIITALEGLQELDNRNAISYIQELVQHSDLSVQIKAIEVIGKLGDEREVKNLIPVLKDENLRVRQTAVDALYEIAFSTKTNLSKLLLGLMADRDVNVRRCVADILNRIEDETIFDRMFEFLRDEDWWVREAIAETLSKIKDQRVVPAAINLLQSPDEGLRRYGIEILMGIQDGRAVQPIIKLLNDPDWWVRERAVEALGYLGDNKVVPILINMLNVKELLYVSAKALGDLKDPRAIQPLLRKLESSSSDIKIVILESLTKLDAHSAVEQIKTMLIDADKDVRNKAREVLRNLGTELGDALSAADRWWEKQNLSRLDSLLLETKLLNGTDLLLVTDNPPLVRINGNLQAMDGDDLTTEEIWKMVVPVLSKIQEDNFKTNQDLDFSYEIPGEGRYRGNLFVQRHGMNAVFRLISDLVPSIQELGLPEIIFELAKIKQGLVLFAGPASCGKTTTLAALVKLITETRSEHIVTIEDPIEYLYPANAMSVVTQREVGRHTRNFPTAVRASLREDPDVIVIGEMRDHETISIAITAAETGHLVLASVHSISAPKTLDRMIDVFPTIQQDQIRMMLSESLQAIVSQQLLNRKDGKGRIAAFEILVVTPAISNLIREAKVFQIPGIMTTGRQFGMQTMDQILADMVRSNLIEPEEALAKAYSPDELRDFLGIEQEAVAEPEKVEESKPNGQN